MDVLARASDTSTSKLGAFIASSALATNQTRFWDALQKLGKPSTAIEVADSVESGHAARETLRKRAGELLKAGLIREIGRRQCRVSGATARTFVLAGFSCPHCGEHRSESWLLGNESAACESCDAVRERVGERAAIAEVESHLSKAESESVALADFYRWTYSSDSASVPPKREGGRTM